MQNIQLFSYHSKAFTKPVVVFSVFPTALLGQRVEKHPSALLRWGVQVETELKGRCNIEVKLHTGFPGGPLSPGFPGTPYRSRKRKKQWNYYTIIPWLLLHSAEWSGLAHISLSAAEQHCSLHATKINSSKSLQLEHPLKPLLNSFESHREWNCFILSSGHKKHYELSQCEEWRFKSLKAPVNRQNQFGWLVGWFFLFGEV